MLQGGSTAGISQTQALRVHQKVSSKMSAEKSAILGEGTSIRGSQPMSAFNGKTVVVTGFGKSERADLEQRLMAAGALVTQSVSSKTQVLVTGPKPGPDKVAKAHAAGAEVIDEATARARLGP